MSAVHVAPTDPLANVALSSALAGVFRGRFCDILLRDRIPVPFDAGAIVYELGDTERTLPREWNDWFTRTAMPALRVPDFNMSSVSPAS